MGPVSDRRTGVTGVTSGHRDSAEGPGHAGSIIAAMATLENRIAVVTGAGQGIGQGIALALASEGATVAVLGRTEAKLADTCRQVAERGGNAVPFTCNVRETETIPGVVESVVARLGGVDVLVNNAYDGALGPLASLSQRAFEKGFQTGPFAAFAFMNACRPVMAARGGGHVVNLVTSAMVRWDATNYGAYAAAKSALKLLTRAAAVEWAPDNIRVNAIAPHALSPGLQWWVENNPEEAAEFVASIPMRRIGDPEADIGRAVVALVGDDLRYLTGATIPLDGGQAFFG
jgi:NAD(P)-dependent dehydrogenase (short-subunit alcohol dehydrogenase family)